MVLQSYVALGRVTQSKKRLKGMWLSSTALTILWAEFAYEKAFRTLTDLGRDAGGDRPYSKKNVQFFLAKICKK